MEVDAVFEGYEESRPIFDVVSGLILERPDVSMQVTKSQVAFRRRREDGQTTAFAWAWVPARYRRGRQTPLVLTVCLRHRDPSPRWKEIVEPYPGRFTHHLELYSAEDLDAGVEAWIDEASALASQGAKS